MRSCIFFCLVLLNELKNHSRKQIEKNTSNENIQISLALMAIFLAKGHKNLRWGNKVNCKEVANFVCRELEKICPNFIEKGRALSNLNKDISIGLKLLEEKYGVIINM